MGMTGLNPGRVITLGSGFIHIAQVNSVFFHPHVDRFIEYQLRLWLKAENVILGRVAGNTVCSSWHALFHAELRRLETAMH